MNVPHLQRKVDLGLLAHYQRDCSPMLSAETSFVCRQFVAPDGEGRRVISSIAIRLNVALRPGFQILDADRGSLDPRSRRVVHNSAERCVGLCAGR